MHALLESSSANTNEMLYSFIALDPDFMLKINGEDFKIDDMTTARGENIKYYIESEDPAEERPRNPLPFKDNVDYNMIALDTLSHLTPFLNLNHKYPFPK